MMSKIAAATLACVVVFSAGTAPASAACSDRPGTPNNLSAEVTSATSIRFKFRITTRDNEISRFYDATVTEKPSNKIVRSFTGVRAHGPYFLGYGGIDHFNINDLKPGGQYCFQIRARTERGTKGCVSEKWSGPVCATIEGGPGASPNARGPFGAVAADGKGSWGFAVSQASEAQARASAVKGCGNGNCKVELSGRGKCAAYADSRANGGYWYGLGMGATAAATSAAARQGCAKGAPRNTCKVHKTVCS